MRHRIYRVSSDSFAANDNGASRTALVAVALIAFLTLVDLFAAQAILPTLAQKYQTSPGTMGVAVNASTFGMAVASVAVALLSMKIDRRLGIVMSLTLLALPTALLAHAPDLPVFAALRVAQGLCMATAFTLTLAHLGERFGSMDAAAASAAYITGNVASNLVGRIVSAGLADTVGLTWTFYAFAALNLIGAALASRSIGMAMKYAAPIDVTKGVPAPPSTHPNKSVKRGRQFGDGSLFAAYGIGFCILFAFIGTFTYVNFVLMRPPLALDQMQVGFIYLVFLPPILTTPLAGRVTGRFGTRAALVGALGLAGIGELLLLAPSLPVVITGLTLVGVGTFLAQAMATSYISKTQTIDRGMASGFYLGS
ncbi:MAG: MFS transporter, partial [Hyphomicrobiaceae bacterium]|nr:MFS transporter [Hyphomicrobiaceae bacterium]